VRKERDRNKEEEVVRQQERGIICKEKMERK
jgi:hypothetical protein